MVEDSVKELPCRYYSYPSKSQGICLILEWPVKNFNRIAVGSAHKFPRVRPTPQCDLEVSFIKRDKNLDLYVENKCESDIRFNATTVIRNGCHGKQLHQESVEGYWLKTKDSILPALKKRNRLPDSFVIEIKLNLYKLNDEIWDMPAWERETEIKLVEDLKNFICAELPAAVVLKTKDDDEITANRAILGGRSSVFRKMFDCPFVVKRSGIVPIEDVNGTTLKTLVHFLYSGKADLYETDLESLEELYYAADKYEVLDLREICAQTMIPLLTTENSLRVLVMTHRHSDDNLKKECLRFICSARCIKAIMETEDWIQLKASDPGLAFKVLETFVKESNTDTDNNIEIDKLPTSYVFTDEEEYSSDDAHNW